MLPTLIVEVAFDTDPLAITPTWTNVSAYVDKVSFDIGKQSQLDAYNPGKLTVSFKNDDRRFDPLHATGPYYGKILPRKKIRLRATWLGVTYELYTGFIDGWTQKPSGQATQTITVTCTDLFGILANIELPSSVYAAEIASDTPKGWWRLSEEEGPSLADSSGNKYDGSYNVDGPLDTEAHPGRYEIEQGHVFTLDAPAPTVIDHESRLTGRPFTIEGVFTIAEDAEDLPPLDGYAMTFFRQGGADTDFWVYAGLYAATATSWFFVAGYNNGGTPVVRRVDIPHMSNEALAEIGTFHFAYKVTAGGTISIWLNGVLQSLFSPGGGNSEKEFVQYIGSNPRTPWQGVVADVAIYDVALTNAQIYDHYLALFYPWYGDTIGARAARVAELAGLDAAQYDIDAGATAPLGGATLGGKALDYLRLLEATEQGNLYVDHANAGKLRFDDRHVRLTAVRSTTPQYTFTDEDTPGTIHVEKGSIEVLWDWQLIYNEVTVTFAGGGSVTVRDDSSIAAYGRRSYQVETLLASAADARNLAEWILSHYMEPIARIRSLVLNPAGDDTSSVAALDLRLGDLVEVKLKPQNVGARQTFRLLVEGKQTSFDKASARWSTTCYLSPAETKVYAVWDSGLWGDALWGY